MKNSSVDENTVFGQSVQKSGLLVVAIALFATACITLHNPFDDSDTDPTRGNPEPTPDIAAMVAIRLTRIATTALLQPTPIDAQPQRSERNEGTGPTPPNEVRSTPSKLHSGLTIAQLVEMLRPSVASITTTTGSGSGFVFDPDGLVATNAHVVDCCAQVRVMVDGRSYRATVLGTDHHADLAVVQINSRQQFQPATFANAHRVAVGDEAIALGFPLDLGNNLTATKGIVSARRQFDGYEYFQHDASINPGSSGGPLADLNGSVIGMNTSKFPNAEGVGFALSAREIGVRLESLIAKTPSDTPQPRQTPTQRPIPTAAPRPSPTSVPAPTSEPEPTREPVLRFSQVSVGFVHSCGLKNDGRVLCWGSVGWQPTEHFQQITIGKTNTCGLREDGKVICWGASNRPLASPLAGQFQQVDAGYDVNCGVRIDGAVHCWSNDQSLQQSAPDGAFLQVSSGGEYSCGIKSDGRISCWFTGRDWLAPLPTGKFEQVSTGLYHACGVREGGEVVCWTDLALHCGITGDGTVGCWGSDEYGQATAPQGNFRAVSAGSEHTCGVKTDNNVVCWGRDDHGQSSAPPGEFQSVSAGGWHTCGVRTDGGVQCWGRNRFGQASPPN